MPRRWGGILVLCPLQKLRQKLPLATLLERIMRNLFLLLLFLLFLAAQGFSQSISTPAQLVQAMHDRYANIWYHSLSFEQQSITHKPDGSEFTELWHEALLLPGHLRVDIGDRSAGNAMLFTNNRIYILRSGKLAQERDYIHPLLVLGFDVYAQPVDTTMQQLKDLHFDLSLLHEESFDGRLTYVVGAKPGDLRTLQFWVDKERLYFVRMIEPSQKEPGKIQDVRFGDYKHVEGGGWLAEHVEVFSDGKLVFEERYSDVKVNPPLKNDLFDPKQFGQTAAGAGVTH